MNAVEIDSLLQCFSLPINPLENITLRDCYSILEENESFKQFYEVAVSIIQTPGNKAEMYKNFRDLQFQSSQLLARIATCVENSPIGPMLDEESTDQYCDRMDTHATAQLESVIDSNLYESALKLRTLGFNINYSFLWNIQENNLRAFYSLLKAGADVNYKNKESTTALFCAISSGNPDLVKELLERGADINLRGPNYSTFLHHAATCRSITILHMFLEKGMDVNSKNQFNESPLHFAAWKGNVEAIDVLLEHGAEVESLSENRETPLCYAARFGHLLAAQTLVIAGAVVNSLNIHNKPPLYAAIEGNHHHFILPLVKLHANLDAPNNPGSLMMKAVKEGYLECVKNLIRAAEDRPVRQTFIALAILNGAVYGDLEVILIALEAGAEVETKCNQNFTSLQHAIKNKQTHAVRLLFEHGAKITISSLFFAIEHGGGDLETITFLLEVLVAAKVDIMGKDSNGFTVLHQAVKNDLFLVVDEILNRIKASSILLTDLYGLTALHHAAKLGFPMTCLRILEAAASNIILAQDGAIDPCPNFFSQDNDGKTPLHLAVEQGHLETVKILLPLSLFFRVNVLLEDHEGNTAFHLAILKGHNHIIFEFLENGYKFEDFKGLFHAAVEGNHLDLIHLILMSKADLNEKDKNGKTPLEIAIKNQNKDLAKEIETLLDFFQRK